MPNGSVCMVGCAHQWCGSTYGRLASWPSEAKFDNFTYFQGLFSYSNKSNTQLRPVMSSALGIHRQRDHHRPSLSNLGR
ncbi:unnamed protein product [Chondrus crispus]|uniref:Uncharacterized protein n=1 Tax=Chondrus crispus TaxID=2769 RepID=R7QFD3_CHOCR|nr:unnamed protein product [Chondrus crispus]CDF37237.1 unnamed protein product [Chondrus crispus]|eukprot:XP_005717056.1 unnamed protein product [Chondrus crispus]